MKKTIGSNVRRIRNSKKLSMDDIRDITKLSKSTISEVESGNGNPTNTTLQKIADALDVDITELYKIDEPITEDSNQLEKEFPEGVYVLRRASKELSPEAKEQMLRIMKTFLEEDDTE